MAKIQLKVVKHAKHSAAKHLSKKTAHRKKTIPEIAHVKTVMPMNRLPLSNGPKRVAPHQDMGSQTRLAVLATLQPFEAFAMNHTNLPIPDAEAERPAYGFWTRYVTTISDVQDSVTGEFSSIVYVCPSPNNLYSYASGIASSVPSYVTAGKDPQYTFISANFETIAVAYQGIRVKNTTSITNMQGESLVVRCTYFEIGNPYQTHRLARDSFAKSSSDPGVDLVTYHLGMRSTPASTGFRTDYAFTAPGVASDPGSTALKFVSWGASAKQTWELEIVTYYRAVPFQGISTILPPLRVDFDSKLYNKLMDEAYLRTPDFTIERNAIKDDGVWDSLVTDSKIVMGGVKALGHKAIESLGSWAGSAWDSLFGRRPEEFHHRIAHLFPTQESLNSFLEFADDSKRDLEALKNAPLPLPNPFTPAQLAFLRQRPDLLFPSEPSSTRVTPGGDESYFTVAPYPRLPTVNPTFRRS